MQKLGLMKMNDSLKLASLGNEQIQAVSRKSKQLNMLFLNLNYSLAPAWIQLKQCIEISFILVCQMAELESSLKRILELSN